jgi:hypothetical protein
LAHARGQPELAARLFGATQSIRERIGAPVAPGEQPAWETLGADLVQGLGAGAFGAACAAGRALTWQQAVDLALQGSRPGT